CAPGPPRETRRSQVPARVRVLPVRARGTGTPRFPRARRGGRVYLRVRGGLPGPGPQTHAWANLVAKLPYRPPLAVRHDRCPPDDQSRGADRPARLASKDTQERRRVTAAGPGLNPRPAARVPWPAPGRGVLAGRRREIAHHEQTAYSGRS